MTGDLVATAPGKLILTGEYAVLDGAPALVIAVDRRAIASRREGPRGSSPFLIALADELARRFGADSIAARTALEIAVDSTQFYDGAQKLGLGSSAAVTVAAAGLALAAQLGDLDGHRAALLAIAMLAHANAQGDRGARGSGADIAAAVYGGTIVFTMGRGSPEHAPASPPNTPRPHGGVTGPPTPGVPIAYDPRPTTEGTPSALLLPTITRRTWPRDVVLIPFFTGHSADTATLVSRVAAARLANPVAVDAALTAIEEASRAACAALAAPTDLAATGLLAAFRLASVATDRLALATGVELVPDCVIAARTAMRALGGTAKTTGAGGGDIAIAVIPANEDVTNATRSLIELGCQPLQLTVDDSGVDTRDRAQ